AEGAWRGPSTWGAPGGGEIGSKCDTYYIANRSFARAGLSPCSPLRRFQVEHSRQCLCDLKRPFYAREAVGDGLIERWCARDNTQQDVEAGRNDGALGVVAQAPPRTVLSALDQEGCRLGLVPDAQSDLACGAGRAPRDRVQRKQYPFRLELVVWPHRE